MKFWLQNRLQVSLDHRLSDSVGDRRNSQRTRFSRITLRNVNSTHGWRKVASGTHPIPDSIEVVAQVSLEILDRLPSTPAALRFAFTCLYASHTSRFAIQNGLALFMRVLPFWVAHRIKPG